MAEKELRMELDGIVGELMEIKEELKPRLAEMKKIGTPVILVLIGLIGTKIGLRIARASVRRLWGARPRLGPGGAGSKPRSGRRRFWS